MNSSKNAECEKLLGIKIILKFKNYLDFYLKNYYQGTIIPRRYFARKLLKKILPLFLLAHRTEKFNVVHDDHGNAIFLF